MRYKASSSLSIFTTHVGPGLRMSRYWYVRLSAAQDCRFSSNQTAAIATTEIQPSRENDEYEWTMRTGSTYSDPPWLHPHPTWIAIATISASRPNLACPQVLPRRNWPPIQRHSCRQKFSNSAGTHVRPRSSTIPRALR